MLKRQLESLNGGLPARLGVNLIAMAGVLTAPLHHRLYWRFCNGLSRSLPSLARGDGVVVLTADSRMKIFLADPYWAQLIAASYSYEADFHRILRQIAPLEYTFIDCGANFGYWSILVSGAALGSHPTLAIEASGQVCQVLRENCSLNGNRFTVVHTAISDTNGVPVRLEAPNGHAGGRIRAGEPPDTTSPVVLTSTLDDVVRKHFPAWPRRLLVKLDVEGQEINAFRGAAELLKAEVLFYYEDHGNDPGSEVTRFVLDELGLSVFYCPPAGPLKRIDSASAATKMKIRKKCGYNFLACSDDSEFLGPLGSLR
jgi:FkbM family methyltransferase